jgi:hypothetical protein
MRRTNKKVYCILQLYKISNKKAGLGRFCGEPLSNEINRVCTRADGTVCVNFSGRRHNRMKREACK